MMEELSNITKNCYYGKGNKVIAIDKALRDNKKSRDQGCGSGERRDSSKFAVDLKLFETMTFNRYCLIIAREIIMYVINNV
jgi:hypothetical protein